MALTNDFILTFDVDWAPDFAIDQIAQLLIEKRVKATWFITHKSEAIENLRQHGDLFELGIHPNMLAGSTHGTTEDEVLTHVKELVPEATSMRAHGLYQNSNWLIKAAKHYGITVDVSLLLPRTANLCPHRLKWYGADLWRIPYFWEDDSEMHEDDPIWTVSDRKMMVQGLRVINFHPIHVVMNTTVFDDYEKLKKIKPLTSWDRAFVEEHTRPGLGPHSILLELIDQLAGKGERIKDLKNSLEQN